MSYLTMRGDYFRALIILIGVLVEISTCTQSLNSSFNEYQVRDEKTERDAVQALLQRLLPERFSEFSIKVNYLFHQSDAFQIQNDNDTVLITGNRGYSAAVGLHYYLKYYCGAHISWTGMQLNLPSILPKPTVTKKVVLHDKYRYYMNVCTFSYSTVWWNWTRWEKEIDWMALNGINLPLAFTGQEYIWKKVFLAFNFTDHDIDEFFTGPAFLAWNRMGNVQGWAGPLPDDWMLEKKKLLLKILNRMRNFGMTPVLPAFSGRVPPSIKRIFPDANVTFLDKKWGNFEEPYGPVTFLQPMDPLFQKIGETFLEYYIQEFGTDHIYNADLFNEMPPPSLDLNYLRMAGEATFKTLISKDPNAIWMVQGWMFYADSDIWTADRAKAFLTSVPIGKMIVLDLSAELFPQYQRLESFYGQPFIWSTIQNYGGVSGLYGTLDNINEGPFEARMYPNNTMVGIGIAPEGIETNEIVYELINEMAWRKSPVNLEKWTVNFAKRRYGMMTSYLKRGILILQRTVYNATVPYRNHGKYILIQRPSLKLKPQIWYDPNQVLSAWRIFIISSQRASFQMSDLFRYDLVDLTRQSLQLIMDSYYNQLRSAYLKKNVTRLSNVSASIEELFDNMEMILSTDVHFLLGRWINASLSSVTTPAEQNIFEYNAKNQISLWGPTGQILDYASKQWAGIMTQYYKKRWMFMGKYLKDCLLTSKPFNQSTFNDLILNNIEIPFTLERYNYSVNPKGNTFDVANRLYSLYGYSYNI